MQPVLRRSFSSRGVTVDVMRRGLQAGPVDETPRRRSRRTVITGCERNLGSSYSWQETDQSMAMLVS